MRPVGIAEGNQSQNNTPPPNINADVKQLFGSDGRIIKAHFGTVAHLAFNAAVPIDPLCHRCGCRQHFRPGTLMASLLQPAKTRRLAPATVREIISGSVLRPCSPGVRYRYHRRSLIPSPRLPEIWYASGFGDALTAAGQCLTTDTDLARAKSSA